MQRDASSQARAMRTKINLGDDVVRLYSQKSLIKEILDAVGVKYVPHPSAKNRWVVTPPSPRFSKTGPEVKKMAEVIDRQMARGKYISAHLKASAVDIKTISWPKSKRNNYIKIVIAAAIKLGAASAMYETSPPHIHLSIKR